MSDKSLYKILNKKEVLTCVEKFYKELEVGMSGKKSSLPLILNPVYRIPPNPGNGVAVSIGGTNGYVSLFHISHKGTVSFINRVFFNLPTKTTKEKLFHLITKHVLTVSEGKKGPLPIGMGLAYPLKPLLHYGFIDGELLKMTKGRGIDGLVGKKVGQEYHRFLIEHYNIDTTVSVANDAICLLLGGEGAELAGVVGTGLNFAYWEKVGKIDKTKMAELQGFGEKDVAVNLESANFDKIPSTALLDIVDKKSDNPGKALAEKETSGAYLYQIFNAGRFHLVSKNCPSIESTDELNDVLVGAPNKLKDLSREEKLKAREFIQIIFERSAQIVAIQIAGILEKLRKTEGIVPVVMEGGIFWKAKNYSSLVNAYLHDIYPDLIPSFARLFGSSRKGIAILARSPHLDH